MDHVRAYYDELFADLARTTHMEDAIQARIDVERCRHIHTFIGHTFSLVKFRETISFLREHLHFEPSAIIVDGLEFSEDHYDDVAGMRDAAKAAGAELWMSARTHRDSPKPKQGELPVPIARYRDLVSVLVTLESAGRTVRLRLMKDHESTALTDLYLDLDPQTMLIVER